MTAAQVRSEARRERLDLADYRALHAFRLALRRFMVFSESAARDVGLTPQQHQALLAITAHPGPEAMSIGELADCLLIKNHSAVGLVSRLGERGLVARRASQQDRRRVLLTVTPLAEALLETISRQNLHQLNAVAPAFAELMTTIERLERNTP